MLHPLLLRVRGCAQIWDLDPNLAAATEPQQPLLGTVVLTAASQLPLLEKGGGKEKGLGARG